MRRNLATVALLLAAACASPSEPASSPTAAVEPLELWPVPDDPMKLTRKAGLEPLTSERLEYHLHAHLDVFKDGRPVLIPGGIGIDTTASAVKEFDEPSGTAYGGIEEACDAVCISPLHTHGADGILHTESPTPELNTFGQFLTQWDVTLPSDAKVYVDGEEYTKDVGDLELRDQLQITVVIGEPPDEIPSRFPSGAG